MKIYIHTCETVIAIKIMNRFITFKSFLVPFLNSLFYPSSSCQQSVIQFFPSLDYLACSRIVLKWDHILWTVFSPDFYSAWSSCVSAVCSLLLLSSSIPVYGCTTASLSIHLLMDMDCFQVLESVTKAAVKILCNLFLGACLMSFR